MVTNDGQDMDPAFNSHLFVILLKLIDAISLKSSISNVLNFVQVIFQNHPQTFNETQTMQLLIRITLAGRNSMKYLSDQWEYGIAQDVFQILQYFLKYNDYSPKLFNICLFAMCILSNRDSLCYPAWTVLKHLMLEG
jgi:hypothetical protein